MADDKVAKMSKAAILKEFGPKIVERFGKDELKFIKENSTGPGGVDTLRSYVRDYFYNKGGVVKKKTSHRKYSAGGAALKKAPAKAAGLNRNKMGYMNKGGYAKKKK